MKTLGIVSTLRQIIPRTWWRILALGSSFDLYFILYSLTYTLYFDLYLSKINCRLVVIMLLFGSKDRLLKRRQCLFFASSYCCLEPKDCVRKRRRGHLLFSADPKPAGRGVPDPNPIQLQTQSDFWFSKKRWFLFMQA